MVTLVGLTATQPRLDRLPTTTRPALAVGLTRHSTWSLFLEYETHIVTQRGAFAGQTYGTLTTCRSRPRWTTPSCLVTVRTSIS